MVGVLVGVVVLSVGSAVWLGVALHQMRQEFREISEELEEARAKIAEMRQKLTQIIEALKEAGANISEIAGKLNEIAETLEEIADKLGGGGE
jgi:septal ring factor EnvC (AmiA/AmiB activator)